MIQKLWFSYLQLMVIMVRSKSDYADASAQKLALLGALSLYLDFINPFLYLLRIFGRRS